MNGPAFVIALTIWLNTCFNKNLVPLLTTVLPQINFIETFSDINVRDFASILMQVLQKLYPRKNTLLAQLRNELIDNALTFHLIAISKQMRPAIETEEEKDLVSAYFLMIQTNKTNFKRAIAAIPSLTGLQDTRGMTLLHNAARQADWEAIKILIENGANPFQINNFSPKNLTILNYAAMNNGPAFVIALAIWLKTCFNQNLVPLLTSVLPQMNFIETFSPINARNFTSILLQVLQQMYPEENAFLINVRNQYIGKGLAYHLIELSRQMQPKMAIQSNIVMLDPSSPILNHPKSPESPDASNGLDSARFLR
ncbi:MAG: ankyrin repeat domain-containing protein [Gammaproteobacteria bacterium]|nr:ankyrin repeat domain-containing protein [Gammaproteobacteria bacterium]